MNRKKAIVLFSVVGILLSTILLVALIVAFGKSDDPAPESGEEGSNTEPSDNETAAVLQSGTTQAPTHGVGVGDKVGKQAGEPAPRPTRRRHTGATGLHDAKRGHPSAAGPAAPGGGDKGPAGPAPEAGRHPSPAGAGSETRGHQGASGPSKEKGGHPSSAGTPTEAGGHKGTPVRNAGAGAEATPEGGAEAAASTPGPAGPAQTGGHQGATGTDTEAGGHQGTAGQSAEPGRHPDTPRPATETGRHPDTPRPADPKRRRSTGSGPADPKGGYQSPTISTEAKRRHSSASATGARGDRVDGASDGAAPGATATPAAPEAGGHPAGAGHSGERRGSASESGGSEGRGHQGVPRTAGKKRGHSSNRGGNNGKEGVVRMEEGKPGAAGGHQDPAGPGGETGQGVSQPADNAGVEPSERGVGAIPMPPPAGAPTPAPKAAEPEAAPAPREPAPTGIPRPAVEEKPEGVVGFMPRTAKSRRTRRTKYDIKVDGEIFFPDFDHVFNRPDKYAEDALPENRLPFEALYDLSHDKLSFEHTYNWSYGRDPNYRYKYFELDYPKMYDGKKRRFWDVELSPRARYVSVKKPKVRTTKVSIHGVSFVEKVALNRENVTLFMESVHGLSVISVITADMEGARSGLQFITHNKAYRQARINTNYLHLIDYIFNVSAGVT